MTTIVDASVAVKWVVEEEGSLEALRLLDQPLMAPDLILTECANALWVKARRGGLPSTVVIERVDTLRSAPLTLVSQNELLPTAVDLALEIAHPIYDCLYLALAAREGGVVVTADRRFLRVARAHPGVAGLVQPLKRS